MRKLLFTLSLALALVLPACKHGALESGGAYAPAPTTNAATGQVTGVQPDFAFYAADAAFELAYSAIDAAFTFELHNRAWLWSLSPNIKHSLDKIRPDAVKVRDGYVRAREAYKLNPTPLGLSLLQEALNKVKAVASAAQAAVPKQ